MPSVDKRIWIAAGGAAFLVGGMWWYADFSAAADLATLLSLGITMWVLANLLEIEQRYLFQGRAPDLLKDLEEKRSDLNDQLNRYDSSRVEIGETLSSCRGIVTTLERRIEGVDGEVRKSIEKLEEVIEDCPLPPGPSDIEEVRNVHFRLVRVTDEVDGIISDQQQRQ